MDPTMRLSIARRAKRAIARAIVCGMVLLLPACHIPDLRPAEAGPALPSNYGGMIGGATLTPVIETTGATGEAAIVATGHTAPSAEAQQTPAGGIVVASIGGPSFIPSSVTTQLPAVPAPVPPPVPVPIPAPGTAVVVNGSELPRVEDFYNDPLLARLIQQATAANRELKVLDQEIQIASNEILARRGAYLPSVTVGANGGVEKTSIFTRNGAVEEQLLLAPGRTFPDPLPNTRLGLNIDWQLDIWRQFRNSRDAAIQRYVAATEKRNYFVTRLIADVAENYYELMALDKRMENLNQTIALQEKSLEIAKAKKDAARGNELAVQRFQAEVSKNQSERLVIRQEQIVAENRINLLLNRYPEPVERASAAFFDLNLPALSAGVPAQMLQNRPDIRQAERAVAAAGLDVKVARARFYPALSITADIGYEAFNPKYLFRPEAFAAGVAGNLIAPLINKKAIQADYLTANAKQLQSVYDYQRTIVTAFSEVVNRMSMAENYRRSIEIKKQQLKSLEASVESASNLFQNARAEYIEVLFAQRDLMEARMAMIEAKKQQLTATVNAYQALGGGNNAVPVPAAVVPTSRFGIGKHFWK